MQRFLPRTKGLRVLSRAAVLAAPLALLPPALPAAAGPAVASPTEPSCRERIAAVLTSILERNLDTSAGPPLNAFQTLNPSALAQAEALDRAVAAGQPRGTLHCLPVTVKDNVASFDLPMAVGSLALLGNQPSRDAPLLARLREAGAIVVGKTAMDEFAFGIRGLSGAAGRVGNAVDPWNSAGGSSAGSGAAVGAGLVPLAVGSDNCGSLRLPAVYNGAVSLRPTQERFPSEGVFPIGFVNGTPGLIARDLATLARGLAVIGPDWDPQRAERPAALAGRRLGVLRRAGSTDLLPTTPEAERMLEQGLALLRAAGAEVVEAVDLAEFDPGLGPAYLRGAEPRINALLASYPASRRDWADVCSSGRLPPEWTAESCRTLFRADPGMEAEARAVMATNRRRLEGLLAERRLDALVLLPDRRGGARPEPSDAFTCFVSSTSGVPTVVLPIGLDARGMPVGVELLGRSGSDEDLVAMATALEAQRGALPLRPATAALPGAGKPGHGLLGIPAHNSLVSTLGWRAWQSRRGEELGDLEPARFRQLTEAVLREWETDLIGFPRASAPVSSEGFRSCPGSANSPASAPTTAWPCRTPTCAPRSFSR
ncbi:MAG: amidase [Synechococcus sp.]|nr:amidase [Synechococcus sp.]